ncbi:MAG: hypothetical protein GY769_18155 [bacterium]|nr:hypothetical protein [bacterium]
MIAEAVERASRLAVLATNPATIEPTRQAVLAAAARAGKEVSIEEVVRMDALDAHLEGDLAAHDRIVATAAVEVLPIVDLVLFAQASMARALQAVPPEHRARILTSPAAAVAQVRGLLLQ